jgi:ABC-type nitrate/sulfonate/bicarbonate transport system substrate-binding protein
MRERIQRGVILAVAVWLTAVGSGGAGPAAAAEKVTIGVAGEILAYASISVALAAGYFKDAGLEVERVMLQGDSAVNAALANGDIDFGALTTPAFLTTIKRGRPHVAIYGLMNKMSMDITVSNQFLQRAKVAPSGALDDRIRAMKNGKFGTLSLGGGPDVNTRYLLRRAGLNPQNDIEIVQLGGVPQMLAGLKAGSIDGFMLSPPTGFSVEARGDGQVFIKASEIPEFRKYHFTAVVATHAYLQKHADTARRLNQALKRASELIASDPRRAAQLVEPWYKAFGGPLMVKSMESLVDGVRTAGRFSPEAWENVLRVSAPDAGLDVKMGDGKWWSNQYQD